jgi:hypothetical protein
MLQRRVSGPMILLFFVRQWQHGGRLRSIPGPPGRTVAVALCCYNIIAARVAKE